MTLQASGIIYMSQIAGEFGRDGHLGAYHGVPWWTDAGASGNFSTGQIGFADFYSKRATAPISNGYVDAAHVGGTGPSWSAPGKYIGTPHAHRVVVVATMTGDTSGSPISGVQIGGVAATLATRASGSGNMRACAIYYRHMPGAETHADIRVTNSNNASQCFMGIYAIYPANPAHISAASGTTTGSGCNANNLTSQAGGICIAVSHHKNLNATTFSGTLGGAWVTNWNSDVGGHCNGAVAFKHTDGSAGNVHAGWAGANNGSVSAACWGHM